MAGNPLFNILGGGKPSLPGNILNLLSQFQRFRQMYNGDPKQQIQDMLNSGKISQEQYNQAVQMANEMQKYLH